MRFVHQRGAKTSRYEIPIDCRSADQPRWQSDFSRQSGCPIVSAWLDV
ncbi:hypothetical protein RISK_004060 [Rhodopirellula islandica]|uniref:Uncharacterized protein n=1 Tax=Rhodopirellula islandica TaxID=595434 RepID=A0A0J1BAU5_RHOIS|nr:hypothetical protein RISK_004060 [Rhodopirellula islandica]